LNLFFAFLKRNYFSHQDLYQVNFQEIFQSCQQTDFVTHHVKRIDISTRSFYDGDGFYLPLSTFLIGWFQGPNIPEISKMVFFVIFICFIPIRTFCRWRNIFICFIRKKFLEKYLEKIVFVFKIFLRKEIRSSQNKGFLKGLQNLKLKKCHKNEKITHQK